MIQFQKLPKITMVCYSISLVLMVIIFTDQFSSWHFLSSDAKLILVIIAALIGLTGSMVSIGKQLHGFIRSKD